MEALSLSLNALKEIFVCLYSSINGKNAGLQLKKEINWIF